MAHPTAEGIALHHRIIAIAARRVPGIAGIYAAESDPTAAADALRDALDDAATESVRAECRRVRGNLVTMAQRSALGRLSTMVILVWSRATSRELRELDELDAEIV